MLENKYLFRSSAFWKDLELMTRPVEMSTPNTQIMVSKYHLPIKGFWEKCPEAEAGNLQGEPVIPC